MGRATAQAGRTVLHGPAMGTRWSVTIDADDTAPAGLGRQAGAGGPPAGAAQPDRKALQRAVAAAVALVDQQMSVWQAHSDLMRLNRSPPGRWIELPAELLQVLACAMHIHRLSAGAFDPGVGALVEAWGFGAARDTPDAAAIRSARLAPPCPLSQALALQPAAGRARRLAPVQFDLGGIAKGFAVDRVAEVLQANGVRHALVALDGELRALGSQAGGAPWPVALERPEPGRRAVHAVLELQDLAVATSGDYRRFLQVGAARLAHSMDPRRAAPVRNDVASVSVLASRCMHADAWATALLVAGPAVGLALAQRQGLDVLFLLRRGTGLAELGLGRFSAAGADASGAGPG